MRSRAASASVGVYGEVGEGLFHAPQPAVEVERLVAPAQDGVTVPRFALGAHAVHVKQCGVRPIEALDIGRGFGFPQRVGNSFFVSAQTLAVGNIRDFHVPDAPERLDVPRVFFGERMGGTQKHQLVDSQPLPERSFGRASQLFAQPFGNLCRTPVVAEDSIRSFSRPEGQPTVSRCQHCNLPLDSSRPSLQCDLFLQPMPHARVPPCS